MMTMWSRPIPDGEESFSMPRGFHDRQGAPGERGPLVGGDFIREPPLAPAEAVVLEALLDGAIRY